MTLLKNVILIISILILYLTTNSGPALWHGITLILTGILTIYLEKERFYVATDYSLKLRKVIQLSGRIFGLLMIIIGIIILL